MSTDKARERRRAFFTTGLGNTGLQSLREKMVLITDLSFSASLFSSFLILSIELSQKA